MMHVVHSFGSKGVDRHGKQANPPLLEAWWSSGWCIRVTAFQLFSENRLGQT